MSRTSTMMVLIYCSVFMLLPQKAKALEFAMSEPENCYLVAVSPENEYGGHTTAILSTDTTGTVNKTILTQTDLHDSTTVLLSAGHQQQLSTFLSYLAHFDLQTLPFPASLLFIGIWLIGFKLTSHPPPSLNRAETSRFNKSYMVMSIGNK